MACCTHPGASCGGTPQQLDRHRSSALTHVPCAQKKNTVCEGFLAQYAHPLIDLVPLKQKAEKEGVLQGDDEDNSGPNSAQASPRSGEGRGKDQGTGGKSTFSGVKSGHERGKSGREGGESWRESRDQGQQRSQGLASRAVAALTGNRRLSLGSRAKAGRQETSALALHTGSSSGEDSGQKLVQKQHAELSAAVQQYDKVRPRSRPRTGRRTHVAHTFTCAPTGTLWYTVGRPPASAIALLFSAATACTQRSELRSNQSQLPQTGRHELFAPGLVCIDR